MSDRYTAEVVISYEKTIANMDDFKKHLEREYKQLKLLQETYSKDSDFQTMLTNYNKLKF